MLAGVSLAGVIILILCIWGCYKFVKYQKSKPKKPVEETPRPLKNTGPADTDTNVSKKTESKMISVEQVNIQIKEPKNPQSPNSQDLEQNKPLKPSPQETKKNEISPEKEKKGFFSCLFSKGPPKEKPAPKKEQPKDKNFKGKMTEEERRQQEQAQIEEIKENLRAQGFNDDEIARFLAKEMDQDHEEDQDVKDKKDSDNITDQRTRNTNN